MSDITRTYDYRDVDLPEVQALIGQEVYRSDHLRDINLGGGRRSILKGIFLDAPYPYSFADDVYQFIRAIDEPPKIKLTRAELIAIAAKDCGVKTEQIVVEE